MRHCHQGRGQAEGLRGRSVDRGPGRGEAEAFGARGGRHRFARGEFARIIPLLVEEAAARLDRQRRRPTVEAGPVSRALANLEAVLTQRLAGDADLRLLHAVADEIDDAARAIERL